ncbi:MAG: hypothetical protein WCH01_03480, partial [Methylococcaceae bacterium]
YINGRLQTPLVLLMSTIGAAAFLLQNYQKQDISNILQSSVSILFLYCLVVTFISIIFGGYFFIKCYYSNKYRVLPISDEINRYKLSLESTYFLYRDKDALVKKNLTDFICTSLINCSSDNFIRNTKRSDNLLKTNTSLIISICFLAFSFLSFYIGNLDKTPEVNILKPVNINYISQKSDAKALCQIIPCHNFSDYAISKSTQPKGSKKWQIFQNHRHRRHRNRRKTDT